MAQPTPIETLDAEVLIGDMLSRLCALANADFVAWVSVGEVGGQRVVRQAYSVSSDPLPFDTKSLVGHPFWAGSVFDDHHDLLAQRRGHWSIISPRPHHANRFAVFSDDYVAAQISHVQKEGAALSIYQTLYGPLEIHDQLRALIYQGDRALGWLGVCRRGSLVRFRHAERLALMRQIRAVVATISLVESQSVRGEFDDLEHLILDHALRVSWATPAASRWMTPRRLEQVRAQVRASRQARPHHLYVEGVWVVIIPMALPSHGQEYLVTLEPTHTLRLSPFYGLEPQVVEAAQLLVRGFSVSQIGRRLGISERLARAHMRRLSRHFAAHDQVELASRIAAASYLLPSLMAQDPLASSSSAP